MRRALQNSMLGFYRTASSRGLMRSAWGRRLFFIAYDLYKNKLEAGPIDALRAYLLAGVLVIDVGADRPALFIELEPVGLGRFGTDVGDLLGFLGGLGYAPYKLICTGAEPCSRADIDAAVAQDGYTDLLFRPAPA